MFSNKMHPVATLLQLLCIVSICRALTIPELLKHRPDAIQNQTFAGALTSEYQAAQSLILADKDAGGGNFLKRAPVPTRQAWPNGPWFVDFVNEQTFNAMGTAFADAFQLAVAALESFQRINVYDDPATLETYHFRRYFQNLQRCEVIEVFRGVLGPNWNGPVDFPQLKVFWDQTDNPSETAGTCDLGRSGWLQQEGGTLQPSWARALFCPFIFEYPRPHSLLAVTGTCEEVGSSITLEMYAPGAVGLHKLIHWMKVHVTGEGTMMPDFNTDPHLPDVYPPEGYGPFNSREVNLLHGLGVRNVDNFVMFAMQAFYSKVCPETLKGVISPRRFDSSQPNQWWQDYLPGGAQYIM